MYTKAVSSLEKVFHDMRLDDFQEIKTASMLKNEIFSFQVIHQCDNFMRDRDILGLRVESPLKDYIKLYKVREIPSQYPVSRGTVDSNYVRREPGLYPDLLEPVHQNERLVIYPELQSLWVEINPEGNMPAGVYPVTINIVGGAEGEIVCGTATVDVEIIDASLDRDSFTMTQWFYLDCLMNYYETEAFSEKHWLLIENFMRNAHKYGQNMVLTPILSPELDTYVGGYRNPAQLVDVKKDGGKYTFNFDKVGRWVDICDRVGMKYLEINHFFTQWGGNACPQVWATVDGEYKRIFGWDTPSDSEDYKEFLGAMIPQLLKYLKEEKNGADRRCKFHISDEPSLDHIDRYKRLYNIVKPLIGDLPTMDAVSSYEFYEQGLIDCPVPYTEHAEEFAKHNIPGLWTYYCCGPSNHYSNRFFSMPSARTRIIGVQLWKFNIAGFLHWGYNFWNCLHSYWPVNPFLCSDAEGFTPSGDGFVVYPGSNCTPWPSLRALVFNEGLQDRAALALCEKLVGREETLKLLLEDPTDPITFRDFPQGSQYLLNLRRRVNETIKNNIDKLAQ